MLNTISIFMISIFAFILPVEENKNNIETVVTSEIDMSLLLHKWKLDHYEILSKAYGLEENEKGDYIHFKADKTYTSVSEGKFEKGNYKIISKTIVLTSNQEKGELKLIVKKLTKDLLKVVIDDPKDSDAKYLEIHFIR
ncbi:MAG: lipocalin family protein [Flavobacteriaceae bacterium]|nr:lipocalin family protein [Flavobacteriaceae bacterium]